MIYVESEYTERFMKLGKSKGVPDKGEQARLSDLVRMGDEDALAEMVTRNSGLIWKVAQKYLGCGVGMDDLLAEGRAAAVHAARTFDPTKGMQFGGWLAWYVKNALKVLVAKQGAPLKLPIPQPSLPMMVQLSKELELSQGRRVTAAELHDAFGWRIQLCEMVLTLMTGNLCLDDVWEDGMDDGTSGHERFVDEDQAPTDCLAELSSQRAWIESMLGCLTDREQLVIRMRFGLDDDVAHTLDEIAAVCGFTRERARQVQNKAFEKMRKANTRTVREREAMVA